MENLAREWTYQLWRAEIWRRTKWLGVDVYQWPTDLLALQDLIVTTRPDFIVETGTAQGGSALFYASILELIGNGAVITVDVDQTEAERILPRGSLIRERIKLIKGDSASNEILEEIKRTVKGSANLHVFLDSHHDAEHVERELRNLSQLVGVGRHIVVFDTNVEEEPEWRGHGPLTAVKRFLDANKNFVIDPAWEKFIVTLCPKGFLKRIS